VVALWIGHTIMDGLLDFPYGWDSLMYHLPLVDHWLRAGSLYAPECKHWSVPGNNELVGLWMVAPFSGDFLVGLTNLSAPLLLALGSVEVARRLGLGGAFPHLAGLAVVANYPVLGQMVGLQNDLPAAGLFVTCLAYGLRYGQQGRPADLIFASIGLGLLTGVKWYTPGYAAVAWATLVLVGVHRRGYRWGLRVAAVAALGAVAWGGYWYIRNALLTGNPIFPNGTPLPSPAIQPPAIQPPTASGPGTAAGPVTAADPFSQFNTWRSTFLGSGRPEVLPLALEALWRAMGPCNLTALLALPLVIAWLLGTGLGLRYRRAGADDGTSRLLLAFWLLSAGLVLGVTPAAVEDEAGTLNHLIWGTTPVRYALSFLSLTVLGLSVLLHDLAAGLRSLAAPGAGRRRAAGAAAALLVAYLPPGLLAGGAAYQIVVHRGNPMWLLRGGFWCAAGSLVAGLILYLVSAHRPRLFRVLGPGLGLALVAATALAVGRLGEWWHGGFVARYDRLFRDDVVSSLAQLDPATTRLCILDNRPYPFFGSYRQFRVSQPIPSRFNSYPEFLQYMRERGVNWVVMVRQPILNPGPVGGNSYPVAYQWALEHPDDFALVKQGAWLSVFRTTLDAKGPTDERTDPPPRGNTD
jgi:hypothetical protein